MHRFTFCHGQKRGSLRGLKEVVFEFEQFMLVVKVFAVVDSVNAISKEWRILSLRSQCVAQNIWMSLVINFSLRFYLINNNTNVFFLTTIQIHRNSYKFWSTGTKTLEAKIRLKELTNMQI